MDVIPAKAGIHNKINFDMDARRTTVSVGQDDEKHSGMTG